MTKYGNLVPITLQEDCLFPKDGLTGTHKIRKALNGTDVTGEEHGEVTAIDPRQGLKHAVDKNLKPSTCSRDLSKVWMIMYMGKPSRTLAKLVSKLLMITHLNIH